MKDEYGGVIINEFVGLKSKLHSIKKLMVKNQVLLKEWMSQQNLMNSKMLSLIKKIIRHKMKRIQATS